MRHTLIFTDGSIADNSLLNKKVGIAGFMFTSLTNTDKYIQPWRSEFAASTKKNPDINMIELGAVGLAMHCISYYDPHKISIFTDSASAYNILTEGYHGKNDNVKPLATLAEQAYRHLIELGFDVSLVLCKGHVDSGKQNKYLIKNGTKFSTWNTALVNAGNTMIDQYVNSIAKYGDLKQLEQYNEDDPLRKGRALTA